MQLVKIILEGHKHESTVVFRFASDLHKSQTVYNQRGLIKLWTDLVKADLSSYTSKARAETEISERFDSSHLD